MKRVSKILAAALVIGLTAYLVLPNGTDPGTTIRAEVAAAKDPATIAESPQDKVFVLDSSHVMIGFTAAKSLAGKIVNVSGGWNGRFGSRMTGRAVIDTRSRTLRQLRGEIEVGSLWSEHELLTRNLKSCGFFNLSDHPFAKLVTTRIEPCGSGPDDATHRIEGNLELNGITKSLTVPARVELSEAGFLLNARFAIDRRDFDVTFKDNSAFPLLNDDNILPAVELSIHIECGPPPPAPAHAAPTPAAVANGAPPAFKQVIPLSQVEFEMVLIPGDPQRNIAPFYLGRTEVTWDEFMPWAACRDLPDETRRAEQRALQQRPSEPYSTVDRGFGMARRPALSMSRLAAKLYCEWLAQQTGRRFRLPTEREWDHAFKLGGGKADGSLTPEKADMIAVWQGNSYHDETQRAMTLPVGSKAADKLGLHDLTGNVAEWVSDTGDALVVRGGSFLSPLDALGSRGRDRQDDEVWNANYPGMPGDPKSPWWFTDAHGVGFRVACTP